MFYNVFKTKEQQLNKDIALENIENNTAPAITQLLVRHLHSTGHIGQFYNEEIDKKNYLVRSNFDIKLVALLGTQLSSILFTLEKWLPLEALYK